MTDENFEKLVKRWPDLFQKSGDFEFSINDGWYNIVDVLCGFLSYDIEQARSRLKYSMENPTARFSESVDELEARVAKALEELPTLAQVKEKFGTMRFYIDGGTAEMHNYIEFAEAMTSRTCEVCGDQGKSRNTGWVKVLCDKHFGEQEEKYREFRQVLSKSNKVKLSDE